MRREVFDCDMCKAVDVEVITLDLPVSDDIDPAGGRSTPSYASVDLCISCTDKLVRRLTKSNSYDQNQAIISNLRKGKLP